jgi:hypothetical protein
MTSSKTWLGQLAVRADDVRQQPDLFFSVRRREGFAVEENALDRPARAEVDAGGELIGMTPRRRVQDAVSWCSA